MLAEPEGAFVREPGAVGAPEGREMIVEPPEVIGIIGTTVSELLLPLETTVG